MPTVFDLLRAAELTWLWIGHPTDNQRVEPMHKALSRRLTGDEALIWLHFGELDWMMHRHGPRAPETLACLGRVSDGIAKAIALVEHRVRGRAADFDLRGSRCCGRRADHRYRRGACAAVVA